MDKDGASNNELLLAAARQNNEDLLTEVFESGGYDINHKDGLGNTALHYAASSGSTDVLERLLDDENCDVDPINRLEGATPLHLALQLKDPDVRYEAGWHLLDAGADPRIKDKNGDTAMDLLRPDDDELRKMMRKSLASNSVSKGDIADDDDGSEGSEGSDSD